MTKLIIILISIGILFLLWIIESRIFLWFFHKLFFSSEKGTALNIEKSTRFPESKLLEKNWITIYNELQDVLSENKNIPKFHEVDKANHKISFDEGPAWRMIVLKAYGSWFTKNCERFPQTFELMKNIPSISTITFSILESGVIIPPHTGKLRGIFRYHLGLSVPVSENCYMIVNGERYYWKQGEGVLFDDTYLHSVINYSKEHRIILFLDVKKHSSIIVQLIDKIIAEIIHCSPMFKKALSKGIISLD